MATTVWHESAGADPSIAPPPAEDSDTLTQRVRSMELVRRLVTEIIDGHGGTTGSDLSDAQWEQLCRTAGGCPK